MASKVAKGGAAPAPLAGEKHGAISLEAAARVFGLVLLIGSLILTFGFATVWALAGLLHIPPLISATMALMIGILCLAIIWKVAVLAIAAERNPESL